MYKQGQGKRIKIQAHYECLQAGHSCKAQGEMRAKPDMKPWVNTYKTKKSSDEERHFRREYLSLGVPPLFGAQDMLIDYKPRACALGYAGVSPLQSSSTSSLSLYYFDALTLLVIPLITEHYQNHYLCYIVI